MQSSSVSFSRLNVQWPNYLMALLLGAVTGLLIPQLSDWLAPVGIIFIKIIKMLVIPMIFFSVANGILQLSKMGSMKRIAIKTLLAFLGSMVMTCLITLILLQLFNSDWGYYSVLPDHFITEAQLPGLSDLADYIIPQNPIAAMMHGEVMATVFFASLLAIAIYSSGEKGQPLANFFEGAALIVNQMIRLVMKLAPIGIFALSAHSIGNTNLTLISELTQLVGITWLITAFIILLGYSLTLKCLKLSPAPFFKKMIAPQIMAFTTSSSTATLPVNMAVVETGLGVGRTISRFVMPLGSVINMNGLALNLTLTSVFAAQIFNLHLSLSDYLLIIAISTLSAISAAGIPGAFIVSLTVLFESLGIPLMALAIIAVVDQLLEMSGTTLNVSTDSLTAVIVAKWEDDLNEETYNG
ncbi:dicarboxylate/amino acid:cation symporter [Endozoicomonas arenosclerae]|uniref:dicarboxylate/amino acid:cation symporter n=1 Tax=Endozoicomonas arenosclerae TaxID=1633495 RepID=UPI0007853D16|nr:dicarboxylate/amino acid:cation symporter [Endozoicomonas arenosclerae]